MRSGTAAPACFPVTRSGDSDRSDPSKLLPMSLHVLPTLKSVYCICKLLVGLTVRFFWSLRALKRENDPAVYRGVTFV